MRRIAALSALTLAASGLAGCATGGSERPALLAPSARYVAMGSSFAAGAGIGPDKPGTPARCSRTTNNYATLLAARLDLALDDQSCGGATTAHVLGPWNELPPQIAAVTPDTRLVTVTVGGNDLNYAMNLIMASCDARGGFAIQGRTLPCRPLRFPSEEDYARTEANLREIARQVKARAPHATLVFVQYVALVPDRPCPATPLSAKNAAALRNIGRRLWDITARAAKAEGAKLLPSDQLSRRHTPCDKSPWATGMPAGSDQATGAPWHPNAAGHAALADALALKLRGH